MTIESLDSREIPLRRIKDRKAEVAIIVLNNERSPNPNERLSGYGLRSNHNPVH